MDFETLAEYLDDRYTPAELIDLFDIPMVDLVDCLWDYLQENHADLLKEITTEGDTKQLEFQF